MHGRIGMSDEVGLQQHSLDVVPGDNLAIIGNSNFQSVKASHCVYKGKWMYEVLLGTSGLMQVGWCMGSCKFNREEGVGDTKDSYAFDGYREAKWNGRSSTKYGMAWEADDVVTCLLDLDKRTASFMLNGKDMGEAFSNISVGPGYAYFPGLSLAFKEIAYCNFGHRPFAYPVDGYLPLQSPPPNLGEARLITESLQKLYRLPEARPTLNAGITNSHRNMVLCHIMLRMCPLMRTMYNVDAYLLPFLLSTTPDECAQNPDTWQPADPNCFSGLHGILSAMWEYSDPKEAREIFHHVFASVVRTYRSSPASVDLTKQVRLLIFIQGLLMHRQTRRSIAIACSFDKHTELPALFHIKLLSKNCEAGLDTIMPDLPSYADLSTHPLNKDAIAKLKSRIGVVKALQKSIMRVLVVETALEGNLMLVSSTFVKYFRNYLKNISANNRQSNDMTVVCPPFVLHSFMQCLLNVVRWLWDEFAQSNHSFVYSADAYIPVEFFYMDTIDYFELQRAGGLKNFLFNEHKDILAKEGVSVTRGSRGRRSTPGDDGASWNDPFHRLIDDSSSPGPSILSHNEEDSEYDAFTPVIRLARALLNSSQSNKSSQRGVMVTRQRSKQSSQETNPCKPPVLELADGCLLLYSTVIHQQMDRMHNIRARVNEYTNSLKSLEKKLAKCGPGESDEVRESLKHSQSILLHHLSELQRSYVWLRASVYNGEAQGNLWWMLMLTLKTIHMASEKGDLFKFIPEFYLSSASKLYKCLREYLAPTVMFDDTLPHYKRTLTSFVKFLSKFHCDSRIVNNDVKTSLANTIATFVTYPEQLRIVEELPEADLTAFVRNMMYAYDEDKPWTSVGHRILATLWRGSGFAMRYDHMPYVRKVRQLLVREHDPFVPSVLLNCIKTMLLDERELSGKFIHSILEHLNWSFSEFVGQLQEVQAQNARGWDSNSGLLASLDAHALRQLRIVDMLFELSVALMRVLELTVALAPDVYLDWEGRDTSETLMNGLVQCINQILSRVTSKDNLFEKVVAEKQPGLSTVQHYPLMTGSSGILLSLINQQKAEWRDRAMSKLINDPSFAMRSINFMLDLQEDEDLRPEIYKRGNVVPYSTTRSKKFRSLSDYEEVSDSEVLRLREIVSALRDANKKKEDEGEGEPMDEDNLCSICYASEVSVYFNPCNHTSCKACIRQHMMTSQECFYCKAIVESITDIRKPQTTSSSAQTS